MTGPDRQPRHRAVRALVDDPAGRAAVAAAGRELPDDTGRWLARLCLLEGLPFDVLVPDARMLPEESIRFFFLDQNWVDSLVDGALSVAASAAPEATLLDTRRAEVHHAARVGAHHERGRRRARTRDAAVAALATRLAEPPAGAPVWSGFLLRSSAVAAWPGLTVTGYATAGRDEPLDLLRLDRTAPGVLVAVFGGIVRHVDVAKPAQALHFGVSRSGEHEPAVVPIRFVGGGDACPAGEQPPGRPTATVPWRDQARGVLDVAGLVDRLAAGLARAYDPVAPPPLRAGAFGIQMVAAAERQAFVPTVASPTAPPADPPGPPAPPPRSAPELLEALRRGR